MLFFFVCFYSNKKPYLAVLGQSKIRKGTLDLKKHKNNNFTRSTVFKRWWLTFEGTFVCSNSDILKTDSVKRSMKSAL